MRTPFELILELLHLPVAPWSMLLLDVLVVALVLLLTPLTSGLLIGRLAAPFAPRPTKGSGDEEAARVRTAADTGRIVGKCENVLIVLFIVADAVTAMALIFTAKTIVRQKEMRQNPRYYIVGTMVNVTYSIVMGVLAKVILAWGRGESHVF